MGTKQMGISTNPNSGKSYAVPSTESDKDRIDEFVISNEGKQIVAVQGLGFVGAITALIAATSVKTEYAVIGVDLPAVDSFWRIASINEGIFPIVSSDQNVERLFLDARNQHRLIATHDTYAYKVADIVVVDVNLDVTKSFNSTGEISDYKVELDGFHKAIEAIGENCREEIFVLVETTVPPGTCETLVKSGLSTGLANRGMRTDRFKIGHSYERVMPGPNYISSVLRQPRVFSGLDKKSSEVTRRFLLSLLDLQESDLTELPSPSASEMAKLLENSYRAVNIAFASEWSDYAQAIGVNMFEVVDAIRVRPSHSNLMYPGLGVGGYCLTKDPLMASWSARELNGKPLKWSSSAVQTNNRMPLAAFSILESELGSLSEVELMLFGVAYRDGIGDTRFTPVGPLWDSINDAGGKLRLCDPFVNYWREKKLSVIDDIDLAFQESFQVAVITTRHPQFREDTFIKNLEEMKLNFILDTVGALDQNQIERLSLVHRVRVVGRGDY